MTVDRTVHRFFMEHRSGGLTTLFKLATHLGSSAVLVPLVILLGGIFWARRRSLVPFGLVASSYAAGLLLETGLKHLVGRARPPAPDRLVQATGFAFPSGHATLGTAVWAVVGVIVAWAVGEGRLRWAVVVLTSAVIVAVDLSRVYLGVHWPSDVIAGSVIGGACAVLVVVTASALVGRDKLVRAVSLDATAPTARGRSAGGR